MTTTSDEHGNMISTFERFDLENEIAGLRRQRSSKPGISSKMLYKNADFRVVLIALDAGAHMDEHHADGTISVQVLDGVIEFSTQGKTHTLSAGNLLTLGASIPHSITAAEEAVFLLTISWPSDPKLRSLEHRGYGT
jgi:quercetin dioxygenase-like cupin family protein